MKKIVFVFVLVALSAGTINAQNLGLRIGGGAELSYQHPLGDANRLELNLGLSFMEGGGFGLSGTYQWVRPLSGNFNWYLGAGAGVGIWDSNFNLAAVGQLGLEFNFPNAPIQLSLDWQPGLAVVPSIGFWFQSFGLGVRYRF